MRGSLVCLATALTLSACTASPEPAPTPSAPTPADEAPPPSVERFVAPSPAMLAAALTGNAAAMQAAAAVTGCPAPSTCPAGFGACTSWSAPSACNEACFESSICTCPIVIEHPDDPPPEPCVPDLSIKRGRTTSSAFRVCFNAAQQACTEWRQSVSFSCGC